MNKYDAERALPYVQRELFEAISDVSEQSYCAGWMDDTDVQVWRLIHEGGTWGQARWSVDDYELERVRRAAAAADSWMTYDVDLGPQAVPLADWRAKHRAP